MPSIGFRKLIVVALLTLAGSGAVTTGAFGATAVVGAADLTADPAGYYFSTGYTEFQVAAPTADAPNVTVPFDGVLTTWRVNAQTGGTVRLVVVHPDGGNDFTVTAASTQTVVPGINTFTVNLPAVAGDHIGLNNTDVELKLRGVTGATHGYAGGAGTDGTSRQYTLPPQGSDDKLLLFNADLESSGGPPQPSGVVTPVVREVAPEAGKAGTAVSITGDNFNATTHVLFGGVDAPFVVDGFQHITAQAPAGGPGVVDVQVVNPAGTSAVIAADRFTYTALIPPTVLPTKTLLCDMPALVRHSYRYAVRTMASAGCLLKDGSNVTHTGHAKRGRSHVKSQTPAAGTPVYTDAPQITLKLG
jgi:hypothetical protein